jgi:hypothetical protein
MEDFVQAGRAGHGNEDPKTFSPSANGRGCFAGGIFSRPQSARAGKAQSIRTAAERSDAPVTRL